MNDAAFEHGMLKRLRALADRIDELETANAEALKKAPGVPPAKALLDAIGDAAQECESTLKHYEEGTPPEIAREVAHIQRAIRDGVGVLILRESRVPPSIDDAAD